MKHKSALLVCALLTLLVLAAPALAADDTAKAAEPITVAVAIGITIAVVQFVKEKLIPTLWDKLGDAGKFVVTVLAAAGVTLYKYLLRDNLPLNVAAVSFLVQVFIGAWFGYEVLKGVVPALSRGNKNKPA